MKPQAPATRVVRISAAVYQAILRDAAYGESFDTVLRRRLGLLRARRPTAKKKRA